MFSTHAKNISLKRHDCKLGKKCTSNCASGKCFIFSSMKQKRKSLSRHPRSQIRTALLVYLMPLTGSAPEFYTSKKQASWRIKSATGQISMRQQNSCAHLAPKSNKQVNVDSTLTCNLLCITSAI